MKYELIHDTIARQVYEKSSNEAKTLRKIKSMVSRELARHQENPKVLLSKEDLNEIGVFENKINLSAAEVSFIRKSRRVVNRRRNLIIGFTLLAIVSLIIMLLLALKERQTAKAEEQKATATALAAKSFEFQMKGDNTSALRFAQYGFLTQNRPETQKALYQSFYQRSKYFYSHSVQADSNAINFASYAPKQPGVLLTGSRSGKIKTWNENLENQITISAKGIYYWAAAISPDATTILIPSSDSTIQMWNQKGENLGVQIKHPSTVLQVYYAPTGDHFVSICFDGSARIWDAKGNLIDSLKHSGTEKIQSADFSPDGKLLLTSTNSEIKIWDKKGQALKTLPISNAQKVKFHPAPPIKENCYWFGALEAQKNQIKIWQICQSLSGIDYDLICSSPQHKRTLLDLDIATNGLVSTIIEEDFVQLWQIEKDKQIPYKLLPFAEIKGHLGLINQALFDRDGENMFTVSDDQTIKKWGLSNQSRPFDIIMGQTGTKEQEYLDFCGHPNFVLSKYFEEDKQKDGYTVWDLSEQNKPKAVLNLEGSKSNIIASPDQSHLLSFKPQEGKEAFKIQLWSKKDPKLTKTFPFSGPISNLAFLADNNRFLIATKNGKVEIWNQENQFLDSLRFPFPITTVLPSPVDTNLLLVAPNNDKGKNQIRFYDLGGKLQNTLYSSSEFDEGRVVKFSPSGKYVLSIDYDKIEIWTIDGQLKESFASYDQSFVDADFSPDERYLIIIDDVICFIYDLQAQEKMLTKIEEVNQAYFTLDMQHISIIHLDNRRIEYWPFAPKRIIDEINQMKISDLSDREKKYHQIKK